ncbi:MAG TPA: TetR/AcrR family transcriptional regulator [Anaeromyxobacteraceae bacterium]|nr:TetR/AcrR family transcriptional regulator [Anaeromyxobacteraceae bacterium]
MTARKPAGSRRREIADAALKVIAEQGLARFTSLAIAREVGVSDAALFRHFPTKEAMVLAAIDRVEQVLFQGFPPAGADPIDRLGTFFRQRIEVIRKNPGVALLVGSEQLAQAAPPAGVARVLEFRQRSRAFVRGCLAEAHRQGLLAPGLGPEEASVLVLGAILALAHAPPPGARTPAGLPERVWAALERLLRRPSGRAPAPRLRPASSAR